LVVEAAQLAHGAHVYAVYGNTFGVVSGGDSKFPDLRHLVAPWVIKSTVLITLTWGLGWLGTSAAAYLTAKRRLGAVEIALVVAGGAAVLVSLRYSSSRWLGAHYHSILAVAGAWLVAAWVAAVLPWLRARRVPTRLLGLGLVGPVLVTAHCLREHRAELLMAERDPILALGAELARTKHPADLVVVQSQEDSFDAQWNRSDNYQDPRVLYVARAKGWVLPADLKDPGALELAVAKGARWYATVGSPPAVLAPYLAKHASLKVELAEGRIYALGADRD
jgi:hypothetical protein